MEKWYSALELANLNLSIIPNTKAGVIYRAKKDNWVHRKRLAKGGGLEYAFDGLPKKVQAEIKARQTAELMKASKSKAVAVVKREREFGELDDKDGRDMSTRHFAPVASGADSAMGTPYLIGSVYQHTWQALMALHHAHHISVSDGVGLFSCNLVKYGAKGYLQGGTQGNLSDVAGLFGDNTHQAGSTLIARPSTHTITHSTPVPCRYYPVPEPEPDKPVSYCRIRPPSDRLPLALRRKRGEHPAGALPLPLICWHDLPPTATPNLGAYIVHNTITATIGGVNVNPLSFSIKTDMDSFCWQGQIEIPTKDFDKIKDKLGSRGNEPMISVVINNHRFVIIAEELSKNRSFVNHSYTLSGRSVTARLSADYATNKQGGLNQALYASQLIMSAMVNTGMTAEYQAPDWLIKKGVYSTDKTPMGVIHDVAEACGAFVYSHPHEPSLVIKPRYKVPAWKLATAEPALILALDPVKSISEQQRVSPLYDNVWLTSTSRLDNVYRRQSARMTEAPTQSDELLTDQIATIAKGVQILSESGTHMDMTVTTRWADKYGLPLAVVGDVWQINDDGGYKAVVVSVEVQVKVENGVPTIWQVVGLDRYMGN
ncbi:hypothetical protein LP115_07780 [Moraxella bovis]|uniref:DNA-binding protein n=1 Tax=Moraxella bovis TaxID=476 RepID=UPI0022274FCC|nr:DNA-binding protein [Moraxella bovis]UYZ77207.1 hypothetical protein LP115_07780 [Moraxella bovis]UZA23313.1 hypothetical protein LP106_06055 [Moraxella bovis]UZA53147.1 hypothetical protein LP111_07780 [Moraxella bovis]UZA58244.1 hypothetical protein LP127_06385 [Moraxella bovis]UZA60842.1 hypothetical protein LP116_06450 [Moraxella bovis]